MIKKIGILTSGGDSPGMNAAIRAVTRIAIANGLEVVGIEDGYKGVIEQKFKILDRNAVRDILDRGGTILGSARFREFKQPQVQSQAAEILKKSQIDALVVIGGDGTYRGAQALTDLGINCIGIPGTIDNDIPATDFTIGFDTALNTIVEAVDKLRDTSSSHHRCSVVEVMGNHCGDLAVWAAISCGAEAVITNETGYNEEELIKRLNYLENVRKKNHAIVILSEKITDAKALANKISENTGFSGRATVLGHIQRGGSPTPKDRVLAAKMGEHAVKLLLDNIGGRCIGIIDNKIVDTDINEALKHTDKKSNELYNIFNELI